MEIDEFIRRVSSEPKRIIKRKTWASSAPLDNHSALSGISLKDFLSARRAPSELREVEYRHILGAPASSEAVAAWEREWPAYHLPADLKVLLSRANGIHLWANAEKERSYTGLAPIEEWELARTKMHSGEVASSRLSDRHIAISYHQDGASFVVLDLAHGRYFLMDAAGPDETTPIANEVSELLDWLWSRRIEPRE